MAGGADFPVPLDEGGKIPAGSALPENELGVPGGIGAGGGSMATPAPPSVPPATDSTAAPQYVSPEQLRAQDVVAYAPDESPDVTELHGHEGSILNDRVRVWRKGGREYRVDVLVSEDGDWDEMGLVGDVVEVPIQIHEGPLPEGLPNGVSLESLLVIVIDRLTQFQRGRYSSHETAVARDRAQECLSWLQTRTAGRIAKGLDGQREKG